MHLTWIEELDDAVREAKDKNRRVFLNFTGDQCVNCRGMEQGMFPRPAVAEELEKMIRAELTLDRESTPKLAARSARYREYEEKTFDTTARPFYVILEADGKTVVDTFAGSTPDEAKFLRFLRGEAVK
jgi:thiol:disulfide interchange protein DsbD